MYIIRKNLNTIVTTDNFSAPHMHFTIALFHFSRLFYYKRLKIYWYLYDFTIFFQLDTETECQCDTK